MNEENLRPDGRQSDGGSGNIYMGKQNHPAQGEAAPTSRESMLADAGSAYARRQSPLSGADEAYFRGRQNAGGVSFRGPGQPGPAANPRGYAADPYRPAPPRLQNGPPGPARVAPERPAPRQERPAAAGDRPKPQNPYVDSPSGSAEDAAQTPTRKEKEPLTPKDKKQITILAVADGVLLLFILVMFVFRGDAAFSQIKKIVTLGQAEEFYDPAAVFDELTPRLQSAAYPEGIDPAMMALYSENNDLVGWLRVPGTGIDNVVVQGPDNNTYLRADYYRRYNKRTRLFFGDFRNNFARNLQEYSKVTIIYGHHLSSDTRIFAEIENYRDLDYYKTHPVVEFHTLYGKTTWKIFGVFYTAVNDAEDAGSTFYYWNPSVTDAETPAFCNEVLSRSQFINPAVDIQPTDKILCLSTCTYIIRGNYDIRCVLMARLVRDGEDPAVDVSAAYTNTNRRMPHAWYKQQGLNDPYVNTPVFTAGLNG